ncbi:MAG TPA: efflux RND transporter permease subunit, partial [Planctomycetes bacterium]|nr:efflux RND transporter permease subunit [Planctomycetota bacterium]
AIDSFPELAERPVIEELLLRRQVIDIAVFGNTDERTLKHAAERIRDDLAATPGISQVELAGTRRYEISVEVSEESLRRNGLTFDDVANAIRRSSLDLAGGSVKTDGGEILLRTVGQAYVRADFERIPVRTMADGSRILVSDVATVVDGFEDSDQSSRFDGERAATVEVFRIGDENAIEIAGLVRDYLAEKTGWFPPGVYAEPWQDNSRMLESRLSLLLRNGAQGLVLVFLVLALFLQFRLSFWVTMGIPGSFLGALIVMQQLDQSINMLSLFAFILVLGIVVDDAIVVAENIHTEQESGHHGVIGAIRGVQGVSVPVIFAVLTSVVAFVPMVQLPGIMGKFFAVIPLTVIPALLFSLAESQLVLPAHLAHEAGITSRLGRIPPFSWWGGVRRAVTRALEFNIQRIYRPALERALHWRYLAIATGIASLLLAVGLVGGGFVRFIFFPDVGGDVVSVGLAMPEGTSAEVTSRAIARIERAADALELELAKEGHDVVRHRMASVGAQPITSSQNGPAGNGNRTGSNVGEVVIELIPAEDRTITSEEVTKRWRSLVGAIPGATEVTFKSALMSAGAPVDVQFAGRDIEELTAATAELRGALANYAGVVDVRDSFQGGKDEVVLDILPEAEALGLSRLDLARQVRQAFHGEEAQRIQRGRDEVKVMVRYPEASRTSLFALEDMRIRTPDGSEVPFSSVATPNRHQGFSTIRRRDRQRTVDVTADVDLSVTTPSDVLRALRADVLPGILDRHPGLSYTFEGSSNERAETLGAMSRLFLLALFVIYGLMAIPFRSYVQPLIISAVIPFGIVGAIGGHLLMGMDLSILSVLGIVALAGVVVNDGIVLVDFINTYRNAGHSVLEAARRAGVARFRPILLTSLTTFVGLLPLLLERSVQAQFLIPMAVSLAFGILFATAVNLLLVPALYLVLDDIGKGLRGLYGSSTGS